MKFPNPRQFNLKQRLLALLIAVAAFILTIFLISYRDRMGLSLLQRLFTYDNEHNNITFSHGARSEDLFAGLDHKLLVCSDGLLQILSPSGESLLHEQHTFSSPAMSSNGKQAVVYDAGGQTFYVISKNKIVFTETLMADQHIRSATINQSGWLAVTTKESGYRGVISVYNSARELFMSISLSEYYPVGAVVTSDNKGVYVLTEGQNSGVFESRLLYYTFEDEEPRAQISLGDQVVLTMRSTSNRSWVLSDGGLYTLLPSGELSMQYEFRSNYLRSASLDGNDFAALLLSPSQSGNMGTLLTIDTSGQVIGSLELDEQVLSLKAAGRYVAVLTANQLILYNRDLSNVISSTNYIQGIRTFALFADGSIALISDELARLYIP